MALGAEDDYLNSSVRVARSICRASTVSLETKGLSVFVYLSGPRIRRCDQPRAEPGFCVAWACVHLRAHIIEGVFIPGLVNRVVRTSQGHYAVSIFLRPVISL